MLRRGSANDGDAIILAVWLEDDFEEAWSEEKYHAEYHNDGNYSPHNLHDFFGALVKKETHMP